MKEMKREFVRGTDWTVDVTGRLICPHGNPCEDDQREGLAECGCTSPIADAGLI